MKYKNEEIGFPCQEMIQEYIDECGLPISVAEVLEYWGKKNFLTKKGEPVKTLEALVNVANSIFVQRLRLGNTDNEPQSKKCRWLDKHFGFFCECMKAVKTENPQKWQKLRDELTISLSLGG